MLCNLVRLPNVTNHITAKTPSPKPTSLQPYIGYRNNKNTNINDRKPLSDSNTNNDIHLTSHDDLFHLDSKKDINNDDNVLNVAKNGMEDTEDYPSALNNQNNESRLEDYYAFANAEKERVEVANYVQMKDILITTNSKGKNNNYDCNNDESGYYDNDSENVYNNSSRSSGINVEDYYAFAKAERERVDLANFVQMKETPTTATNVECNNNNYDFENDSKKCNNINNNDNSKNVRSNGFNVEDYYAFANAEKERVDLANFVQMKETPTTIESNKNNYNYKSNNKKTANNSNSSNGNSNDSRDAFRRIRTNEVYSNNDKSNDIRAE
eukprot:Pgem_evm1s10186